jgi:hypothetical protein
MAFRFTAALLVRLAAIAFAVFMGAGLAQALDTAWPVEERDVSLVRATAAALAAFAGERADLPAIGEDEHGSPRFLRRGATRLDDGAINARPVLRVNLIKCPKRNALSLIFRGSNRSNRNYTCSC